MNFTGGETIMWQSQEEDLDWEEEEWDDEF